MEEAYYKSKTILQIIPAPANLCVGHGPKDGRIDWSPVMAIALIERVRADGEVFRSVEAMHISAYCGELDIAYRGGDHFQGYRFMDKPVPDWWSGGE